MSTPRMSPPQLSSSVPHAPAPAEPLGRRSGMAVESVTARWARELLDEANLARHEAAVANSARTTFLGTISHEFRTPLTAVQGFADLLAAEASGPLNEAQRHQVDRIRTASDHLLKLIEEILTFSGQQAGRFELRVQQVDLARLVREAAALVEPLAHAKGLRFPLNIPDGPIPLWTDPDKVRQIVLNLASNAVKFTEAGELRLDLELAGSSVLVRLGDTGMGIAPEHAQNVFEAFWQADQSEMRAGGMGLGLAVTRQLAGLLGGEVTLQSEPGVGSVFTVRLPFLSAPEASEPAESSQSSPREQRVQGRRQTTRRGGLCQPPAEESAGGCTPVSLGDEG